MKKSLLVLSLLLPTYSLAQTSSTETSSVTATDTSSSTETSTSTTTEVKSQAVLKNVSSLDLKDANLSMALDAEKLKITGSLPKVCADRLSLSNIQKCEPSKSSEELKDIVLEKSSDLKEYAATVEAQITYSSDSDAPTLRDCIAKAPADSAIADLSTDVHFSRTVTLSPQIMIAGLVGEPMDLKSPEFLKMEKQIEKLDCKDCNSNWKLLSSHLDEARGIDSPLLNSMMNKLLESALTDMETKINDASSVNTLEKQRDQLVEMGKYTNTDSQVDILNALFTKAVEKNRLLASTGFKTASMASKHADFEKDTYTKMQTIAKLPEAQKEALKEKAKTMSVGNDARISFLSSIDGDHPEVKKFLDASDKTQRDLVMQMRSACPSPYAQTSPFSRPNYNFTQCGELQKEFYENEAHLQSLGKLKQNLAQASNQNWNNIFASWDQRGVAYNPTWKSSFMLPTQGNTLNSMPEMYDPRVQSRYSNFDASTMYQVNGSVAGQNIYN